MKYILWGNLYGTADEKIGCYPTWAEAHKAAKRIGNSREGVSYLSFRISWLEHKGGRGMKYYRENPDLLESFIDFHQEENGCPILGTNWKSTERK
jgi:hypothetical protein